MFNGLIAVEDVVIADVDERVVVVKKIYAKNWVNGICNMKGVDERLFEIL